MFWFKLWNTPTSQPDDVLVPLFALLLPQKTFNRLGFGAKVWEQFMKHCLNVDVHAVDELNSFVSMKTYLQVVRLGVRLCGADKLVHWYVDDTGPHHFGPVGMAVSMAPTVADCLDVWFAHRYITSPMLQARQVHSQNEVILQFDPILDMGDISDVYMELCLLITRKKLLDASNGQVDIRVRFAHPPVQPLDYYQHYFGFKPEHGGQQSTLTFKRSALGIESDNYTGILYERALAECAQLRENYKRHERVSHQVHHLLVDGSKNNRFYTLDEVADKLNMSVRTLTRRLSEENASFRELLSEVRLELAKKQLQNTRLPIKTICSNAGFTNVSAFSRAFRKYVKISPSAFRQER